MPQIRSEKGRDRFEHPGTHWMNNPEVYLTLGYIVFCFTAILTTIMAMRNPALIYLLAFPALILIGVCKTRVRHSYNITIDDVKNAAKRSSALADEKLYLTRLLEENFLKAVGKAQYLAVWPWQRSTQNSVNFIARSIQNVIEHLEEIEWFDTLRIKVKEDRATEEEKEEYNKRKQEVNFILQRINGEIGELPDMAEMLMKWKCFPLNVFCYIFAAATLIGFTVQWF